MGHEAIYVPVVPLGFYSFGRLWSTSARFRTWQVDSQPQRIRKFSSNSSQTDKKLIHWSFSNWLITNLSKITAAIFRCTTDRIWVGSRRSVHSCRCYSPPTHGTRIPRLVRGLPLCSWSSSPFCSDSASAHGKLFIIYYANEAAHKHKKHRKR